MAKTRKFIKKGRKKLNRASKWLSSELDRAPDLDELKEAVSDRSLRAVHAARKGIEDLGQWFGEMAANLDIVEPPKSRKSSKRAMGAASIGALALGGWYFFNSQNGKDRRLRFRNYLAGLRDRIVARMRGVEVFADQDGDLVTVDENKVAGLAGVHANH